MDDIRVAHVTSIATSLRYLLSDQLATLQQAGYDITGISTPAPPDDVAFLKEHDLPYLPVNIERAIAPFQDIGSLWNLYRVMRQQDFTIVHTHNPKPGLLGQFAAKAARVPIIVNTLHGFYFHEHMSPNKRRFYITLEKIAAKCSDLILSQNREDIETAIKEGITTEAKIKYLGNGINVDTFDPTRIPDDMGQKLRADLEIDPEAPIVGFVGRLAARRKGFTAFLQAAEQIHAQRSDVVFLIIGASHPGEPDGVDSKSLKDLTFYPSIRYLGQIRNDTLPHHYSVMSLVVLPSLFEGVPRVLMEATAMGIPIVATNVRGNREVVQEGVNGHLVPLDDVDALTAAILSIISDSTKAAQMRQAGRQLALDQFDEQIVFQRVLDEYARLLEEQGFSQPKG